MNWQNVEIFSEVMLSLSFTEVAQQRNVAPSSISRAVANLEQDLGVKLFQRSPRQIVATEAGELFFNKVSGLINAFEEAKQSVSEINSVPRGTLRVSAPIVYGQNVLVPHLAMFKSRFPQIELELQLTDRYVDLMAERIDIAIRLGELGDSNYIGQKLHGMGFKLCAAPSYLAKHTTPQTPIDLKQHDCLIFVRQNGPHHWRFRDQNATQTIAVNGTYRLNNSSAVYQCVLSGMGISLLPDWLVGDDIAKGKVVELLSQYQATSSNFDSAAWMLQPSRGFQPLKSRAFIDFLRERVAGQYGAKQSLQAD
ncbi:LysR family transcriptional regulator [Vibrio coralliilyticus]|uniref:LysR family transcriptional regulator n=1 Tax=Vibrio coralliilyticus TaxID=190893 RepID=UPI0015606A35|nr:LysR family transcriptional regulator [Vibrio coralliilyticus]NRF27512.1 LysR family transcriptional regulator [Vibrio coralliilyticus]NRF78407.1 LysR family transcriptional regulator [Vibrio coralliilyticus]